MDENLLEENENLLEVDENLSSENNKSENESLYDSFDDDNTFETLQKGLYSSNDELTDNTIDNYIIVQYNNCFPVLP